MRGRSLQITWQAEDTNEALKVAYWTEADGTVRTRLHGRWLLRAGWSLRLVAEILGTHYRWVRRWVALYREGGLPTVRGLRMGGVGQPSFLTAEAQAGGRRGGGDGAFLRRRGDSRRRCRGGRDARFSLRLRRRDAGGAARDGPAGLGQAGVKVRQRLPIASAWRYLFLAVDGQAGRLFWCWLPALTAIDIRGALRGLQPFGLADLVRDRAATHRDRGFGPRAHARSRNRRPARN